jgi:mannose-6-phosphate isomerase-like protein (cupin superfamily)
MVSIEGRRYEVADFATLPPTPCPCGFARRAFTEANEFPGTLHRTEITLDARRHYHRHHTEVYYFLECQAGAEMELDGDCLPVRPGMSVLIPPGVRHRALGRMTVMILSLPKFDPDDEWFD